MNLFDDFYPKVTAMHKELSESKSTAADEDTLSASSQQSSQNMIRIGINHYCLCCKNYGHTRRRYTEKRHDSMSNSGARHEDHIKVIK